MSGAMPRKKSRRLPNGATLHVLPVGKKYNSDRAFAVLQDSINTITDLYADDLGGFVLMPWGASGNCEPSVFICTMSVHPKAHDLPHYAAEALRRQLAGSDVLAALEDEEIT